MKKRTGNEKWLKITAALLTLAVIVTVLTAIVNIGRDSRKDSLHQLEKSLRRSVMACYATEGVYPPDVEYLKEHYGLQIDGSRYIVHYTVFAENLMPDITVLERTE